MENTDLVWKGTASELLKEFDLNAERKQSSHRDDLADDTRNADDKQTIEPEEIVCAKTTEERDFTDLADDTTDANDRNTPFSHIDLENVEVEYEC
jgi:hypothetical protein